MKTVATGEAKEEEAQTWRCIHLQRPAEAVRARMDRQRTQGHIVFVVRPSREEVKDRAPVGMRVAQRCGRFLQQYRAAYLLGPGDASGFPHLHSAVFLLVHPPPALLAHPLWLVPSGNSRTWSPRTRAFVFSLVNIDTRPLESITPLGPRSECRTSAAQGRVGRTPDALAVLQGSFFRRKRLGCRVRQFRGGHAARERSCKDETSAELLPVAAGCGQQCGVRAGGIAERNRHGRSS